MYYVIQVFSGKEEETKKRFLKEITLPSFEYDIFVPKRKRMRKKEGKMFEVVETCFPGYLFIETDNIVELKKQLYNIKTLTKLLGIDKKHKDYIAPLRRDEEEMINVLLGKSGTARTIEISHIYLKEGKDIVVIDGPLKGLEGKISNVNLHKRQATVLINLMGQLVETILGIDIIEEKIIDNPTKN